MSFKLENFVAAPSMELLNLAKKTDLLNIADHYALTSVKPSMLKHEIKNILIKFLVDEEILDPSALSSILITQTDLQLRELEIQRQIQLEKLRLEQEERKLEREERIRVEQLEREERMQKEKLEMEERIAKEKLLFQEKEKENERLLQEKEQERQYNLRMKELEMQDKVRPKPLDLGTHFDVTKHIRVVPPFQEKEVDKYFLHFEKVAENLKWPKEHWTLLLQSVVIGKAREIYTQLSLEQSSDYDKVKEVILKAYELVPEAYRQKFRNCRKEKFLSQEDTPLNLLQYVSDFRNRLLTACEAAKSNLKKAQGKMKQNFDKNTKVRSFKSGDKVLALLPIPGRPLQARYFGPYTVEKKASDLNYIITTPDRRKQKQLCHINMLKEYVDRDSSNVAPINVISSVPQKQSEMNCEEMNCEEMNFHRNDPTSSKLQNSDILKDLDKKLSHLDQTQRDELKMLILEYEHLFPDIPTRTDQIYHDVDIEDSKPIKQHPYRMNPMKLQYLREEVQYLLDNDFIEPSQSDWSSPCILVPKPDGTFRMCTDYRKVNSVTKTDSFPVPRMDDCIDNIGQAKYVTKFDLLKGFWQIPLTDRAKEISAFVTPDGLYQYKVMPFGMKNSPATFQRLINMIITGLDNCKAYIDDAIIYSEEWDQQIKTIRDFFERLSKAKLTINLAKSEFCHATLTFLGHVVGQGQVKPVEAKVKAISDFPVPTCKRQLMRFLGMAGYYRKFCDNFSVIAEPLTNLLSKRTKFIWTNDCQKAFDILKAILKNEPVLLAPNFAKEFKLAVDASDTGAGSVLMQEDGNGVDHPVSYFSKKFNKHQKNYSTIEKECLSLILALQHFEVYLTSSPSPIVVFSDHNPLIFIHKMKNKNQRLLRWSLLLQEYNLDIRHIKGKDNIISDALSRA